MSLCKQAATIISVDLPISDHVPHVLKPFMPHILHLHKFYADILIDDNNFHTLLLITAQSLNLNGFYSSSNDLVETCCRAGEKTLLPVDKEFDFLSGKWRKFLSIACYNAFKKSNYYAVKSKELDCYTAAVFLYVENTRNLENAHGLDVIQSYDRILCLSLLQLGPQSVEACSILCIVGQILLDAGKPRQADARFKVARQLYGIDKNIRKFVYDDFSRELLMGLFPDEKARKLAVGARIEFLTNNNDASVDDNRIEVAGLYEVLGDFEKMERPLIAFRFYKHAHRLYSSQINHCDRRMAHVLGRMACALALNGKQNWGLDLCSEAINIIELLLGTESFDYKAIVVNFTISSAIFVKAKSK